MTTTRFFSALIVGAGLVLSAAQANAASYKLDPAHSFIDFRIQHLGFSWMDGRFNTIDGDFTFDGTTGSINVTVDAASVDTNHAERDKHLRGEDFLDVEKFPTASFKSTAYEGDENGGVMKGDLTIHGVTQPVEIKVTKVGEGKDPWGGYRAGFKGELEIRRADYGISYDLGPAAETMKLDLLVEGIRQ